jgi:hypothetical protein
VGTQTEPERPDEGVAEEDTEGQSLSLALGMGALSGRAHVERRARSRSDEDLPRLTKKFPRMRDDSRE